MCNVHASFGAEPQEANKLTIIIFSFSFIGSWSLPVELKSVNTHECDNSEQYLAILYRLIHNGRVIGNVITLL